MEEADKGCSEFCVTASTVTRIVGILIHSRLKVLAVNLSRPFGWIWLYAGLAGSINPRWLQALKRGWAPMQWTLLSMWFFLLLLLPHGCEWVNVSFGTRYRLTGVVLDKGPLNDCVCVYIKSWMCYQINDKPHSQSCAWLSLEQCHAVFCAQSLDKSRRDYELFLLVVPAVGPMMLRHPCSVKSKVQNSKL